MTNETELFQTQVTFLNIPLLSFQFVSHTFVQLLKAHGFSSPLRGKFPQRPFFFFLTCCCLILGPGNSVTMASTDSQLYSTYKDCWAKYGFPPPKNRVLLFNNGN